jgi:hypothetical protein
MTPIITRLMGRIKAALLKVLLDDKLRPFVWLYYAPLVGWLAYGTFFAAPVTYVQPAMGATVYDMWVWGHSAALVVMFGLWIEGKSKVDRDKLSRIGVQLQTGGHSGMFCVALAYEVSAICETSWGEGTYSIFFMAYYVAGCLLLTLRGLAQIFVDP